MDEHDWRPLACTDEPQVRTGRSDDYGIGHLQVPYFALMPGWSSSEVSRRLAPTVTAFRLLNQRNPLSRTTVIAARFKPCPSAWVVCCLRFLKMGMR
jgi:hypothetical protein